MSFTEPSGPSKAEAEAQGAASLAANTAADEARTRAYEAALRDGPPANTPTTGSDPTVGRSPQPSSSPNVYDPLDNSQNWS